MDRPTDGLTGLTDRVACTRQKANALLLADRKFAQERIRTLLDLLRMRLLNDLKLFEKLFGETQLSCLTI